MNFSRFVLIYLLLAPLSCQAQEDKADHANINFLQYVDAEYVDILSITIKSNGENREISLPYYEFSVSEIGEGKASIFAIDKKLSQQWVEKAIADPKGKCNQKGDYLPAFYIICEAARLFTEDTTSLYKEFDLYAFLIQKSDLAGPFMETSESGSSEYYDIEEDTPISIYKYKYHKWEKVGQDVTDKVPRAFGEEYIRRSMSD